MLLFHTLPTCRLHQGRGPYLASSPLLMRLLPANNEVDLCYMYVSHSFITNVGLYELWGYIKLNKHVPSSGTMNLKLCKFPCLHLTPF